MVMERSGSAFKALEQNGWIVASAVVNYGGGGSTPTKVELINAHGEKITLCGHYNLYDMSVESMDKKPTNDESLAQKVNDAAKVLNAAMSAASDSGIDIKIDHIESYEIGKRIARPIVSVNMSRPII